MAQPQPDPQPRRLWLAVIVLGAVVLNYPFLMIFDRPVYVGGWPLVIVYLLGCWAALVGLLFFYARLLRRRPHDGEES